MYARLWLVGLILVFSVAFISCSGDATKGTTEGTPGGEKKVTAPTEKEPVGTKVGEVLPKPEDEAIQYIVKLESQVKEERLEAVQKLKAMGEKAARAVGPLARRIQVDEVPEVKAGAAEAIGAIGMKAKGAIPALVIGIKDEAAMVRKASAMSLAVFKGEANSALVALKEAISKEKEADVKAEMEKAVKEIESAPAPTPVAPGTLAPGK
jgi:hypothetical protein